MTMTKEQFVANAGWEAVQWLPLPADASFRYYTRLCRGHESRILMDASAEKNSVMPFILVARYLSSHGFSAPEIFAEDVANGWLLLEDLGQRSYTRLLQEYPKREAMLYQEAVANLVVLHQAEPAAFLAPYDTAKLMSEIMLFVEWYVPTLLGHTMEAADIAEYAALCQSFLEELAAYPPVTVLRDYHADNLMWLDNRRGRAQVGILDFQDALLGSPIYDMVSLLEDARRDVSPAVVDACIDYYIDAIPQWTRKQFMKEYALLGAQRNLKIIGVFARKAIRDKNPVYLGYIPRVLGHLQNDLQHPSLEPLATWLAQILPEGWSQMAARGAQ
jgi:aminoglycoside/choline kinase family phosphotransferase